MENKKIKNATPNEYQGIKFKSILERNAYVTLMDAGLDSVEYEPEEFILYEKFTPTIDFYKRDKNSKELVLDKKSIRSVKYTPDFIVTYDNIRAYIEMKGKENDCYYLKKKMFRHQLEYIPQYFPGTKVIFFELRSKRELLEAINIIKNYHYED